MLCYVMLETCSCTFPASDLPCAVPAYGDWPSQCRDAARRDATLTTGTICAVIELPLPTNVVYEELQWCTLTCISKERREEAINRLLKPAAPPDSGNGVVVPHEAPDGPPKPKKKGKK